MLAKRSRVNNAFAFQSAIVTLDTRRRRIAIRPGSNLTFLLPLVRFWDGAWAADAPLHCCELEFAFGLIFLLPVGYLSFCLWGGSREMGESWQVGRHTGTACDSRGFVGLWGYRGQIVRGGARRSCIPHPRLLVPSI
ncbi:hypothetical protein C8R47DRAFT_211930 [Mycena vitilis]|nr:hypothetical protein C8R47DRAFT_211930 [Mycena vitilis]